MGPVCLLHPQHPDAACTLKTKQAPLPPSLLINRPVTDPRTGTWRSHDTTCHSYPYTHIHPSTTRTPHTHKHHACALSLPTHVCNPTIPTQPRSNNTKLIALKGPSASPIYTGAPLQPCCYSLTRKHTCNTIEKSVHPRHPPSKCLSCCLVVAVVLGGLLSPGE